MAAGNRDYETGSDVKKYTKGNRCFIKSLFKNKIDKPA
jgi:hypothetical protein